MSWGSDSFAEFAFFNKKRIREAATIVPEVVEVFVLSYKVGIADGSGACVNDLGALYYMGDLVEQDYVKAAELYGMAAGGAAMKRLVASEAFARELAARGITADPDGDIELHGAVDVLLELLVEP